MKKYLIVILLLLGGYCYAQEVGAWIDTTKTGAAKYISIGNNQPMPVNIGGPVFRLQDSIRFQTAVIAGDSIWTYNFNGKYSYVEVAYTDTATATDTVYGYIGIPGSTLGVTDTLWSRVSFRDLSNWNVVELIANAATTKQYWMLTPRPYLVRLKLANVANPTNLGQKGFIRVEAK
jgi:hypothetical protein